MKKVIGITGMSGGGKSTVSAILKEKYGADVVDADKIAHSTLLKGNGAYESVLDEFGSSYLREDGEFDRRKLGQLVFSSKAARNRLESLMLPIIIDEMVNKINMQTDGITVIDAPLLLESEALTALCNEIIYVRASYNRLLERIMSRDSIDEKTAAARLAAQKEDEYFLRRSTIIIENDTDRQNLEEKVRLILCQIC